MGERLKLKLVRRIQTSFTNMQSANIGTSCLFCLLLLPYYVVNKVEYIKIHVYVTSIVKDVTVLKVLAHSVHERRFLA